eukprot:TRINITY_DN25358_c0_g1_i2.p1 TRINITY_DN25358_c0_g1~~TRINITY_DN25358_c0_g1_i2.p1  ORF type:complete len:545 (+),score=79.30 TRINITY_DN25358_c0_g1_i2:70-1704(+)
MAWHLLISITVVAGSLGLEDPGTQPLVLTRPSKTIIRVGYEEVDEDTRFSHVRQHFGVPNTFIAGTKVDMTKVERASGGLHAQVVFSDDGQYIVKVSTNTDWVSLHSMLPDYISHLEEHDNSMLPRFFTAFKLKGERWVVMFNWDRPGFTGYQRMYDLKGTTCSRDPNDRLVKVNLDQDKIPTLKDLNFVQNEEHIYMSGKLKDKFLNQLQSDTDFLRNKGLMDYSLILRVSIVGLCQRDAVQRVCTQGSEHFSGALYSTFFQAQNGYTVSIVEKESLMYIYSFGMIDILQPYNALKSVADWYKMIKCGGDAERDTVSPEKYQERFVNFFQSKIAADARELQRSECERAADKNSTGNVICTYRMQPPPTIVEVPSKSAGTADTGTPWLTYGSISFLILALFLWICCLTTKLEEIKVQLQRYQNSGDNLELVTVTPARSELGASAEPAAVLPEHVASPSRSPSPVPNAVQPKFSDSHAISAQPHSQWHLQQSPRLHPQPHPRPFASSASLLASSNVQATSGLPASSMPGMPAHSPYAHTQMQSWM